MPPDPVLGLLAVVGLLVYAVIGGLVSATILHLFFPKLYGLLTGTRTYNYPGELWFAIAGFGLLWPICVLLALPVAILAGPWLLTRKVATYAAKAQLRQAA